MEHLDRVLREQAEARTRSSSFKKPRQPSTDTSPASSASSMSFDSGKSNRRDSHQELGHTVHEELVTQGLSFKLAQLEVNRRRSSLKAAPNLTVLQAPTTPAQGEVLGMALGNFFTKGTGEVPERGNTSGRDKSNSFARPRSKRDATPKALRKRRSPKATRLETQMPNTV